MPPASHNVRFCRLARRTRWLASADAPASVHVPFQQEPAIDRQILSVTHSWTVHITKQGGMQRLLGSGQYQCASASSISRRSISMRRRASSSVKPCSNIAGWHVSRARARRAVAWLRVITHLHNCYCDLTLCSLFVLVKHGQQTECNSQKNQYLERRYARS